MDLISSFISNRIKRNQNFIGLVTGPTGGGKSYMAVCCGFNVHKSMKIKKAPLIIYDLEEFIQILRTGNLQPGQVIIIDEGGLIAAARDYMSTANKILSMIAQSFRYMRLVVLVCVPDPSLIDVNVRKLVHMVFMTDYIDRKNNIGYVRPYIVFNNRLKGKIGYRKMTIERRNGSVAKINQVGFPEPPKWFLDQYEKKKDKYVKGKLKDFQMALKAQREPGKTFYENPFSKKS